ncbi:hypothetical protein HMI55_001950, partial [Coelomomyces lativittatus]
MLDEIDSFMILKHRIVFEKIDGDLLNTKISNFLDYPSKKEFNLFVEFSKESMEPYIPKNEKRLISNYNMVYNEMEIIFSNFFETTNEIFNASKHLELNKWSNSDRNEVKEFNLELRKKEWIFNFTISFNTILKKDGNPFSYYEDSNALENINDADKLFLFNVRMFVYLLKYTFYSKYHDYCLSFGHFEGIQTIPPSSSSSNPTISASPTEPYYRMRILGFLANEKMVNEKGKELPGDKSFLLCLPDLSDIHLESMRTLEIKLKHFLTRFNTFLHSKNIRKTLLFSEIKDEKKVVGFFSNSFFELIYKIPDELIELKNYLLNFYALIPDFFKEVRHALGSLDFYNNNKNLKNFKSAPSKNIYFNLTLQPNEVIFVEWGPALNLQLLKEAELNSPKLKNKKFLKKLYNFTESFSHFQENYIKYDFTKI